MDEAQYLVAGGFEVKDDFEEQEVVIRLGRQEYRMTLAGAAALAMILTRAVERVRKGREYKPGSVGGTIGAQVRNRLRGRRLEQSIGGPDERG